MEMRTALFYPVQQYGIENNVFENIFNGSDFSC